MDIISFVPEHHRIKALVYGTAGAGKTTFGGTADMTKTIFASAEGGLLSIADKKPQYVKITSMKDLADLYSYLQGEHPYETVVIDSISEINDIIKQEIQRRTGKSMQIQDWGELKERLQRLFRQFRDLPMHVLFLAQESYINDEQKIKKIVPELDGKSATTVARYMDIVGYIHVEADGTSWIETDRNKNLLTKDRSRAIGNKTPSDFQEWQKRVGKIETGESATVSSYAPPTVPVIPAVAPPVATTTHLTELKNKLIEMGAASKEQALGILNKVTNNFFIEFVFTEEQAQDLLIQLMQEPIHTVSPSSDRMTEEQQKIASAKQSFEEGQKQTAIYNDYTDVKKVKGWLEKLYSIEEVVGLGSEVEKAYNNGDMTQSTFVELATMIEARANGIRNGTVTHKKKTLKKSKTAL